MRTFSYELAEGIQVCFVDHDSSEFVFPIDSTKPNRSGCGDDSQEDIEELAYRSAMRKWARGDKYSLRCKVFGAVGVKRGVR